jgi:N-acylneuraminate cytidylyltransferase
VNVLAVIPARGGSKRVPGKNLRPVGGRPLLAWSIEAAQRALLVTRVVVSTDDAGIAGIARELGADVHHRDPILATDNASIDGVLLSVLRSCDPLPDLVVTLQPTCPLRAEGLIDGAIRRLVDTASDACFTAYAEPQAFLFVNHSRAEFSDQADWRRIGGRWVQLQQMTAADFCWRFDGSVVVTRAAVVLSTHRRLPLEHRCRLQVHPNERAVDVDVERDVLIADALMRAPLGATA